MATEVNFNMTSGLAKGMFILAAGVVGGMLIQRYLVTYAPSTQPSTETGSGNLLPKVAEESLRINVSLLTKSIYERIVNPTFGERASAAITWSIVASTATLITGSALTIAAWGSLQDEAGAAASMLIGTCTAIATFAAVPTGAALGAFWGFYTT